MQKSVGFGARKIRELFQRTPRAWVVAQNICAVFWVLGRTPSGYGDREGQPRAYQVEEKVDLTIFQRVFAWYPAMNSAADSSGWSPSSIW